jgi:hypothetical protein
MAVPTYRIIELPPYGAMALLVRGGVGPEVATNLLKRKAITADQAALFSGADGCTTTTPSGHLLLWVESVDNHGAVAHEALHGVVIVLRDRGLQLADESDEAYCYLLSYVVDAFHAAKGWRKLWREKPVEAA